MLVFYLYIYHSVCAFSVDLWRPQISMRLKQTQSVFAEQKSKSDKSHPQSKLFSQQVTETSPCNFSLKLLHAKKRKIIEGNNHKGLEQRSKYQQEAMYLFLHYLFLYDQMFFYLYFSLQSHFILFCSPAFTASLGR